MTDQRFNLSRALYWTAILLMVLVAILMATTAHACRFCGRSSCRSCVRSQVVKQVVPVVQQPNVYVIQQNQATPLVAQGSSLYRSAGYQSAVLPYFDPNQFARDNAEILKQAQSLVTGGQSASLQWAERITSIQSEAFTADAKGRALSTVAEAMGLASPQGNQSQGVVIVPDGRGGYNVQQLTLQQVETITQKSTIQQQDQANQQAGSLVNQFCGKCHGLDVAEPKAGLYLGDDPNVALGMRENWYEITVALSGGNDKIDSMPPADHPQPTAGQRAAIVDELQSIIQKGSAP